MPETVLQEIVDMLETYTGRDKIVRTLCYTTKLISAVQLDRGNDDLSARFAIFSTKMSQTRANLRLLDDLPMVQYSMDYGLGEREPDKLMAMIGVVTNVIDHMYYPVDKICWLIEQKILTLSNPKNAERFDTINSVFWVASIYLNLMKTVRLVHVMRQHRKNIDKIENESSVALIKLEAKERMEIISIVRLTLDFVHAASTLPNGWLWGGKFSNYTVGIIGTTSSFIGLYQYFARKRLAKN